MSVNVFCWNVGESLRSTQIKREIILREIRAHNPDIICLQECPKKIPELLKKEYPYIAQDVDESQLAIFSRKKILKTGMIKLIGDRIRARPSLWVELEGFPARIYNCQFPINRVGIRERTANLEKLLADAPSRTIICGDMNTTIPRKGFKRIIVQLVHKEAPQTMKINGQVWNEDERYHFVTVAEKEGFREALDITKATWALPRTSWEFFQLKLDWFLVRKIKTKIKFIGEYIDDHRAFMIECETKN